MKTCRVQIGTNRTGVSDSKSKPFTQTKFQRCCQTQTKIKACAHPQDTNTPTRAHPHVLAHTHSFYIYKLHHYQSIQLSITCFSLVRLSTQTTSLADLYMCCWSVGSSAPPNSMYIACSYCASCSSK